MESITVPLSAKPTDWVLFNIDQVGYYRVNYDLANWILLHQQLIRNHSQIGTFNRAQFNDVLNLARAGHVEYQVAMDMTMYLVNETRYLPWNSAISASKFLDSVLIRTPAYGDYRAYTRKLITPLYQQLGFYETIGDTPELIRIRKLLLERACKFDIANCVEKSIELYSKWMKEPNSNSLLNPNIKPVVACTAIQKGGIPEWNFAFERYTNTTDAEERELLLIAMSCTKEVHLLHRLLESYTNSSGAIRKEDGYKLFISVAANPVGSPTLFRFLQDRWDQLRKLSGIAVRLGDIFLEIATSFQTQTELNQLLVFREKNRANLGSVKRGLNQSIELTKANIKWIDKRCADVASWLKNF